MSYFLKLIALTAILFSQQIYSEDIVLKVMSYNINALPSPVKRNKGPLLKFIADEIHSRAMNKSEPDILLLQEAFSASARKKLIKKLKLIYPHHIRPGYTKKENLSFVDSGIYIFSKYNLAGFQEKFFKRNCAGFDCMSNKGIFFTKVKVSDEIILDLYTTHMNSSAKRSSTRRQSERAKRNQIRMVKELYRETRSADNPMIFAGDVNLHPQKKLYPVFVKALNLINSGEVCLETSDCLIDSRTPHEDVLGTNDQHFMQHGSSYVLSPVYLERGFREPVTRDSRQRLPSDHYSYEVHYQFSLN